MKLNFIFYIQEVRHAHVIMSDLSPFIGQQYKRENVVILQPHNIVQKLAGKKLPLDKFYFAVGTRCWRYIEERFNEEFEIDTFLKWSIYKPKSIKNKEDLIEIPC